MRYDNSPPERRRDPNAPNRERGWGAAPQEPAVPGEITWRTAQYTQRPPVGPGVDLSPASSEMAGSLPATPPGRPAGSAPATGKRGKKGDAAPKRPLTPKERLRKRNRRLLWILIPTTLVTILAAVAGGLVVYFGPLIQLIQTSTGHVIARSSQEQGINVPTDILSGARLNVLLLGSDNDTQKFVGGNGMPGNGVLTQTIIVASLDPASNTITLISIPRDSWVHQPGTNDCLKLDEIAGRGASPDEAIQFERTVVERDYGVPISYYAWVGLAGFVKVIDTLGGVDVDVLHPIVDDAYPKDVNSANQFGYQRLYIPAGPQHLDGETALEYVRSRHSDLTGDFGRSQRQQSVLLALEKKLNTGNIIGRIPDLANDLQGNILTDMSVAEITKIANFARGVPHQNTKQLVLAPPDYSAGQGTLYRPDGEQAYALLPDWQKVTQTLQATIHPDPTIDQNVPCTVNPVPGQWSGQTTG